MTMLFAIFVVMTGMFWASFFMVMAKHAPHDRPSEAFAGTMIIALMVFIVLGHLINISRDMIATKADLTNWYVIFLSLWSILAVPTWMYLRPIMKRVKELHPEDQTIFVRYLTNPIVLPLSLSLTITTLFLY